MDDCGRSQGENMTEIREFQHGEEKDGRKVERFFFLRECFGSEQRDSRGCHDYRLHLAGVLFSGSA